MNGEKPHPGPFRITEEEVPLACAAFLIAHEGCGEEVELAKLSDTLVCYCDLCNDLRTFLISAQR
jgi:hypothetical protein